VELASKRLTLLQISFLQHGFHRTTDLTKTAITSDNVSPLVQKPVGRSGTKNQQPGWQMIQR
jgi:hypothetical protein